MMGSVSRAEAQRRAREWLRIDFDDADRTAAFEAAKHALSADRATDIDALIAVGEFGWVRAMLPAVDEPAAFLRLFGAYFIATADDGFARASWPRVVAMTRGEEGSPEAATLRSLAIAAEAVGDRTSAGELNAHARGAPQARMHSEDVITSTVYGSLGYEPDAPKGRLLLRPEIDPAWHHLRVDNIHIGDALILMEYSRIGERMEFAITQLAGAYPIRLIFEPVLSTRVSGAFVDGTPASLDFRPHGERIIVPVQIMLDDRRVVRFE
jgi:hypothetical protein